MKVEVFDPAMCCSSGVCGADVDPELVRFSALVDKMKRAGTEVQRHNLAHEPLVFAQNDIVRQALTEDPECLPIVFVDGRVVSKGAYPADEMLLEKVSEGGSHVA